MSVANTAGVSGKTIIVTGAAQGIGRAIADAFRSEGANIIVADIIEGEPFEKEAPGEVLVVKADITDDASLAAMVAAGEDRFGPVDVLINNAALFASEQLTPFADHSLDSFDRMMTVNVRGLYQASRAVLPSIERAGGGAIVNIGSGTVFKGPPGLLSYVASKGAVHAMSSAMARELGPKNIRVNCIAPSFTLSKNAADNEGFGAISQNVLQQRIIKRDMLPDDLVGAARFLASDSSAFLTGQILNVDGGVHFH